MPLWLNESDIRAVLPLNQLIETIARALAAFSEGRVRQPVRSVMTAGLPGAFFASMPAVLEDGPAMGAKLVTVYPQNAGTALSTHQAVIVLLDATTGAVQAFLDGRYITEARTAASTAIAVRALARPDARTLAIIGSGVQAASHLESLAIVRSFSDIRCWSPTAANLHRFVDAHPQVRPAASAAEAVCDADVVLAVTASTTPVIQSEWIKPGACVISVGACVPKQRELDPKLIARGRIFVDSRAAALKESGDIVIAIAEGHIGSDPIVTEIGDVIAGRAPGRTSDDEVTIYKPLGIAVEDVAAAHLAYTRACAEGLGVVLTPGP
jgi:alanine dehydrogenase